MKIAVPESWVYPPCCQWLALSDRPSQGKQNLLNSQITSGLGQHQNILYATQHIQQQTDGVKMCMHFVLYGITRKSGHRCASLCITWISCVTCIIFVTCTTEISHQLISWDIIDIAGILVPQKYITNLLCEIPLIEQGSLIIIEYDWISLNIIEYHWISLNII